MKHLWSFLPVGIAGVYMLVVLISRLRAYRKRIQSVEWPMISATFKSGSIDPFQGGYIGEGTKFRLKAEFSYSVADAVYPGNYVRDFLAEDDAASLQQSLKQGPVYIRYNPVSPAEYILDPYRDVWQPIGSSDAGSTVATAASLPGSDSADAQTMRVGKVDWWTSPVSLGKLFIFQAAASIVLFWNSERNIKVFWFMAGAYFVWAMTTRGCFWWAPSGKLLPTWIGRIALAVLACGWILAGAHFSN